MKRRLWLGVLALAAISSGLGLYRFLVPTPERIIRQRLNEVARLASFAPNEGALAKAFNAQKLSTRCTSDVELVVTTPGHQQIVNGRDELLALALRARNSFSSLTLEFPDILIVVASDKQSAVADLTARTKLGGEKEFDVREFRCALKKIDGEWLISRVESSRTLRD